MGFLLLVFFIGIAPCMVVWRWTRGLAPGRRATIRAAAIALFMVPVLVPAPSLHGAFILPAWFVLLTGAGEMPLGDMFRAVILPSGVVFLILSLLLRIRRSSDRDGFTEKPKDP